jgi:hypothetical protein
VIVVRSSPQTPARGAEEAGQSIGESDARFPNRVGEPFDPNHVYQRDFNKLLNRSGRSPGSRAMLRLIVASETSTPLSSSNACQFSLKVRSGLDFSCSGSHSLKAAPFTEGLPGIFIVSTSPVWRLRLSQRLMVEQDTPKTSATSFLGMPRSMAASVFNLRSFE